MKKNNIKKATIIAEIGVNHNGSLAKAFELIKKAKLAGADYVKFQSYDTDSLCLKNSFKANYQKKIKKNKTQYQMLKELELSENSLKKIVDFCKNLKMKVFFSVFDLKSLKKIKKLNLDFIKLPSGEINNFEIISNLISIKSKIIISSGLSNFKEVMNCYKFLLRKKKYQDIIIMHCNTEYPTPVTDLNLNVIKNFKKKFKSDIGFSDHSVSVVAPSLAYALGANYIEKHFTLSKNDEGPDHRSSLNFIELKRMVANIRYTELALGETKKKVTNSEKKNLRPVRKSIVASKSIKKGETYTIKNITTKRPHLGISASEYLKILGIKAKRNYKKNEYLTK